ncbi:MAG: hotdog fold thioesterase [Bacteroidetes bacterium]|nr:hotdog fold thioesterase [Bacteroidota bacterium]
MFNKTITLEFLRTLNPQTINTQLGIEFTEIGEDFITAKMPVDHRTHQPFGILHGGASVVLAESLGSVASLLCLKNPETQRAVGVEINANHVRSVRDGWVHGRVTALHVGRTTHVWDIRITNEEGKLVCVSRLTVAVVEAAR